MSNPDLDRTNARRRGLGMGLSALLGGSAEELAAPAPVGQGALSVPTELLQPSRYQPRRHFAEEQLEQLADSIRARGVMQPLLVRSLPDGLYEIVAGERRWRAAQQAGLHELPVIVCQLSDREALEVALIENVQRQDLGPIEEAAGYRRLIDEFGHTQEALGQALGKSRSHVANMLRLLGLPEPVRLMVEDGRLSAGHARALLGARDPQALAQTVLERGLNVRQTEALVQADARGVSRPARLEADADTRALEHDMTTRLGLPVRIQRKGNGGVVTIACSSIEQLDQILARLR